MPRHQILHRGSTSAIGHQLEPRPGRVLESELGRRGSAGSATAALPGLALSQTTSSLKVLAAKLPLANPVAKKSKVGCRQLSRSFVLWMRSTSRGDLIISKIGVIRRVTYVTLDDVI